MGAPFPCDGCRRAWRWAGEDGPAPGLVHPLHGRAVSDWVIVLVLFGSCQGKNKHCRETVQVGRCCHRDYEPRLNIVARIEWWLRVVGTLWLWARFFF